jgi:hypothetical protein
MHPFNAPGHADHPAATPPPNAGIAPGAANAGGINYLFYTATDGTVQMKSLDTGEYASAGGHLVSAPSAIVTGASHEGLASFALFGQGTDNALWYTTCYAEDEEDFSCSGSWASLGGTITSRPSAVALDTDTYWVYARGSNGAVWGRDHTEAGWGGWYQTGGALLPGTGPSAAMAPDGSIYVLAVGTNKQLYIQQVGVTGFTAAGGQTTSTPALVSTSDSLVGLVRGADNALWYHQFPSTTPGWHSLGGTLKTGTGGSASGDTPYAYGVGGNGQVWQHSGLAGGSWSQVTP